MRTVGCILRPKVDVLSVSILIEMLLEPCSKVGLETASVEISCG